MHLQELLAIQYGDDLFVSYGSLERPNFVSTPVTAALHMTPHEAEAELERLTRERKVPDVGKLKIARVLLLAGPDLALSRQAQSLLRISLVDERRTHLVPCKSADCGNTFVCREHGPSEPCPAGGKEGADRTWECPRCELRARDRQSDAMEQGAPRLHINAFDRAGEM